ncbi:MAG: hypothetical protein FWB90_05805 [Fibromonadales bacterium]|nr:hypothetical protein [Fibromonadales bacterium]
MKILSKALACAATVSIMLLSCTDSTTEQEPSSSSALSSSSSSVDMDENEWHCVNGACASTSQTKPIIDSRVVSYKKPVFKPGDSLYVKTREYIYSSPVHMGIITDEDFLKSAFPHIFEDKQAECNYFAIFFKDSDITTYNYWILSQQDMKLYEIYASGGDGSCSIVDFNYFLISAMLVCDNTAEKNLKDQIKFNPNGRYFDSDTFYDPPIYYYYYNDYDWDCEKGNEHDIGVFF